MAQYTRYSSICDMLINKSELVVNKFYFYYDGL